MSYVPPPTPNAAPVHGPVPTYFAWSIVVTVLCFLTCCSCLSIAGIATGIVAIVFGGKVNKLLAQGQFDAALQASKNAKIWAWVTTGILIASLVFFAFRFVAIGGIEGYKQQIEEARKQIEQMQGH